jgi:phosphoesterase RecJ-like protein
MREILRLSYPEKEIYLLNSDYSNYLEFLGGEDEPIADELYADALALVLDTGSEDRISNKKYKLCREIAKIDHHIDHQPYGDYCWIEENKSSTCEMVAEFYYTFRDELKINKEAATYLYTGMVTDSGRFRFREVDGDTMRYAGMLLDVGIDTNKLYANLYIKDFQELKFQSYVYKKMKMTENGVAYIFVDKAMQKKFGLTSEQASASVSFMESIRGSLIWVAFIENAEKKEIRVRMRSRFVQISDIAERYRGGGHACAAGATLYSKKELKAILAEADAKLKEYKESNEGWL